MLLLLAATACGKKDAESAEPEPAQESTQSAAEDFVWTRTGTFMDANDNYLSITPSDQEEYPGWSVGCMLGEDMYGWFIEQEGNSLHGNLVAPYEEGDPYIVTITEEGEDGVLLRDENGNEYHFTPYDIPEAAFTVNGNIEGFGQIAYAPGEETPEFDDEFPSQSIYLGLEGPETYTFAARPDEGYKLLRWDVNGQEYSREAQITIHVEEDLELLAVFGPVGTDETPVDLSTVTTLGQLLGLPDYGSGTHDNTYVYAFEQDGVIYRATAEMPAEVSDAVMALDFEDPEYDAKLRELVAPLAVTGITNVSEGVPTQEELDALIGKTGAELLAEGFYNSGWNLEEMIFYWGKGAYEYEMTMEGEHPGWETFDEADIEPLTVTSATYTRIGNPSWIE